jgi:hypothetical protein
MQLWRRYVPLRVGSWFASRGIKGNVVEMDWWVLALTGCEHV